MPMALGRVASLLLHAWGCPSLRARWWVAPLLAMPTQLPWPSAPSAEATPAQGGGHKITSNSPGFGDVAPGNGETKGGTTVAFIIEVNMRLQRKTCWAEQGTVVLLDECCFWDDVVWSFGHHGCRCLTHDLDLLYYSLILPVCKVTSILVTIITGIQLLARCMKSYQSQRESKQQGKEWWPGSPPSMVWGAADYPTCAICLRVYEPGEALELLSCSRACHGECIGLWHRAQPRSKTCPLCLRGVTAVAWIPLGAHNGKR